MTANVYDLERSIESRHCIYSRRNTYVMFENIEINWVWTMDEVREFDSSIRLGLNALQISEKFNRSQEEVMLMAIDRIERVEKRVRQENSVSDYTMLENVDINWCWDMKDVYTFDEMHRSGLNYQQIADKLGRTEAEIIIMTFDRALQDKLVVV